MTAERFHELSVLHRTTTACYDSILWSAHTKFIHDFKLMYKPVLVPREFYELKQCRVHPSN